MASTDPAKRATIATSLETQGKLLGEIRELDDNILDVLSALRLPIGTPPEGKPELSNVVQDLRSRVDDHTRDLQQHLEIQRSILDILRGLQ